MDHSEPKLLIEVMRGPLVESVHRGHLAVSNAQGRLIACAGDPHYYTFARSTAKPLQAIPLLEAGGSEKLHLTAAETAITCASHNGEPGHTQTVEALLQKAGLDASFLNCGPQEPMLISEADRLKSEHVQATALHNNCSGKHAGMLALAAIMNAPTHQYTRPEHPVQQKMLQTISEMCSLPKENITLGTDGCGVPVFGLPLSALALGYARLGLPDDLPPERAEACRRILSSIRRSPFHLAGSGRYDTRLAEVTRGRILGKMGAEGVYAATVPEKGIGLALKVEDGAERAIYPAATEALLQLGLLQPEEADELAAYHRPPVINRRKEIVGELRPVFRLTRLDPQGE